MAKNFQLHELRLGPFHVVLTHTDVEARVVDVGFFEVQDVGHKVVALGVPKGLEVFGVTLVEIFVNQSFGLDPVGQCGQVGLVVARKSGWHSLHHLKDRTADTIFSL